MPARLSFVGQVLRILVREVFQSDVPIREAMRNHVLAQHRERFHIASQVRGECVGEALPRSR